MTEKHEQNSSHHLHAVVAVLMSLLFVFAVLELFFRIRGVFPEYLSLNQDQFYGLKEGTKELYPPGSPFFTIVDQSREPLADHNYNLLHFPSREYAYPLQKDPGSFRIVGMGDSFAWGWGVFDNRVTVFKLLEAWFNVMKNGPDRIEVINAAQPGAAIDFYGDFLHKSVLEMKPDMVMLLLNLNDIECYHASVPEEANALKILNEKPDYFSSLSKFYEFIRYRLARMRVSRFMIQDYHDSYFGSKKERWEKGQKVLLDMNNTCRNNAITFVVVIFPLLYDLDGDYQFTREVKEIETFLTQNRIRALNLLPDYLGKKPALLWVLPADSHPNEIGHRIAAESIYQYCKKEKLVPLGDFQEKPGNSEE